MDHADHVDLLRDGVPPEVARWADLGAGTGYFSRYLSDTVGVEGTVFAVEVEPNLVAHLRARSEQEGTANVVPVLASFTDARLPPRSVDLVLIVDTFHHIDDRLPYLKRLRHALRPGGRVAIIVGKPGKRPVGPEEDHKNAPEQVIRDQYAAVNERSRQVAGWSNHPRGEWQLAGDDFQCTHLGRPSMNKGFTLLLAVAGLCVACRKSAEPTATVTNAPAAAGSGNPITAPVDYLGAVAKGKNPLEMTVRDVMSSPVITVPLDADVEECCRVMESARVRRVPVVDNAGKCCGIVSQADLARRASESTTAEFVRDVSQPGSRALKGRYAKHEELLKGIGTILLPQRRGEAL